MRDHQVYLSMTRIEEYTSGMTFDQFTDDQKTIDAVDRNLEIIGEATKHIPEKIRNEYPEVPWKDMAAMRDKLIHGYFGVNLEVVWKTINERLPTEKPLIVKALAKMDEKAKKEKE